MQIRVSGKKNDETAEVKSNSLAIVQAVQIKLMNISS